MLKNSAKKAVEDVLSIELGEKESQELYYSICNYLIDHDDACYIGVIRFKYSLLCDGIDSDISDYFIMEFMLEKMRQKHPLILMALTNLVISKC
ncbi:hypothetical protein DXT99_06510 [Pontibacter diazotrophicus]|uniref:Uncharacterized protein n=1 Tax=Pontibacter diazotrophicus TaxID=1400979 RepID=A0A3D8LEZ3_9BACT|nr:hypothetical protein [Pontibacter diazotrophicus]RDV16019.1 hypothetical protein DXT99_06510 [Pontibacter diazotrophicus]